MKAVIEAVLKHIGPGNVRLDDFVDRLCYRYTPILLGIFMLITGTIDNFGKPLNCMLPQEFSTTWAAHVHQYCYVTGTYVKKYNLDNQLQQIYVHYYQWVPYVLIILALFMRLPLCFWRFGQRMSDIEFGYVTELSINARTANMETREEHLKEAASYIYQVVNDRRHHNGMGSLVSYLYLLYKIANVVVVCTQIHMLNLFVGHNSWDWGITLFWESWSNFGWKNFTYFPRIAYCEFGRDFLGQAPGGIRQEVRCALGINMLNEKVFLCLYFWYYSLLALTLFNTIFYAHGLLSPFRFADVRTLLNHGLRMNKEHKNTNDNGESDKDIEIMEKGQEKHHHIAVMTPIRGTWSLSSSCSSRRSTNTSANCGMLGSQAVSRFVDEWLGQDGLLLLRWVRQNAGGMVASELALHIYQLSKTID